MVHRLVDEITFKNAAEADDTATASAILGPFWRDDHPKLENGASIIKNVPSDGEITYMYGTVTDFKTGKPIANAEIDIWQASTNGLYEQQDKDQDDCNLRGKFSTDADGKYAYYCLRPTPYPVPNDGPAGKLLELMDRHPYRPAHIHLIVSLVISSIVLNWRYDQVLHKDYKPVTTQIFDSVDPYLTNDSVFAVKDQLVVDFVPRKGDDKATLELKYDIKLVAHDAKTT